MVPNKKQVSVVNTIEVDEDGEEKIVRTVEDIPYDPMPVTNRQPDLAVRCRICAGRICKLVGGEFPEACRKPGMVCSSCTEINEKGETVALVHDLSDGEIPAGCKAVN